MAPDGTDVAVAMDVEDSKVAVKRVVLDSGTSISVKPLYGVKGEDPLCYLLSMDGRLILLDCGWDDRMAVDSLGPLAEIAHKIDAVLISHPDTAHLGALPYAFGTLGMRCKVYATLPVHKMGMMFMYDHFLSRRTEQDFALFSLDDVDKAFGAFVPVRYTQHSNLDFSGSLGDGAEMEITEEGVKKITSGNRTSAITVTAYAAGHTLGGAVWKIHKDAEDVVYAVDYNHRREKHLNGTVLDSINRPSLLITDAFNAQGVPHLKSRDDDLMKAILSAVRRDGNVLVPIDPAGRVLELLLLLEERWAKQQLGAYQLVLLTTVAYNTLEFARSHLEWMGENVGRNFDTGRLNAFNTRYLTLCHSVEELNALRPGPKVVLASFGSLECGYARLLFTKWAEDPKNLIVLTDRGAPGSLSRRVRVESEKPPGARQTLDVSLSRRVPLIGEELDEWRAKRRDERVAKQQQAEATTKKTQEGHLELEEEAAEAIQTEPTGMEIDAIPAAAAATETPAAAAAAESLLGVAQISGSNTRAKSLRRGRCLVDGFTPAPGAAAPMFPDETWNPAVDDFGEEVDVSVFARAVSESQRAEHDGKADAAIAQAEGATKTFVDAENALRKREAPLKKSIPPPAPPPMPEEAPDKMVCEDLKIILRAAVHACDYEGRADGRSVRTLLQRVEPRRVVLVHGTEHNTAYLHKSLAQALGPHVRIDSPDVGETIECTSDVATYGLELSQDLIQKTRLRECAGYQVGWVDGVVVFRENANGESVPVLTAPTEETVGLLGDGGFRGGSGRDDDDENTNENDEKAHKAPTTPSRRETAASAGTLVSMATAASVQRRESAFVGDLKLTDFKIVLASHGIGAEFKGGALVCLGGAVCVRKSFDSENLTVEGALSDDFYKVRSILYQAYQI